MAPMVQFRGPESAVKVWVYWAGRAVRLYAFEYTDEVEELSPELVKKAPLSNRSPVDIQFQVWYPPYVLPPSLMRFVTCQKSIHKFCWSMHTYVCVIFIQLFGVISLILNQALNLVHCCKSF